MATHRHPLADKFRAEIDSLRLLAIRLDDPAARPPVLPKAQSLLLGILRGVPPPSPDLRRELYTIQRDLVLLFRSQRREYAVVERINGALHRAKLLAEQPPLGRR